MSWLGYEWTVLNVDEKGLSLKLIFQYPLEVSQNNNDPEIVKIRLDFEDFTDEYG